MPGRMTPQWSEKQVVVSRQRYDPDKAARDGKKQSNFCKSSREGNLDYSFNKHYDGQAGDVYKLISTTKISTIKTEKWPVRWYVRWYIRWFKIDPQLESIYKTMTPTSKLTGSISSFSLLALCDFFWSPSHAHLTPSTVLDHAVATRPGQRRWRSAQLNSLCQDIVDSEAEQIGRSTGLETAPSRCSC
jgi:hypothetical protein